ncbi:MAG: MFS transporter [Pseudomonadota bacterium]
MEFESRNGLSRKVLAAYAAPAFSQALIHGPVGTVIQGIYGKHFGVALASIALVLVISRVFDAFTDPIIGYLSDRYRTRWGKRKPWLLGGSLLAVVACWYLYVPPGTVSVTYFLVWFLLAYLGWTISEIPYRAWMAELSEDYNERTRIATWRTFARYMGFIAFYGIPLLPFFETSEFTPETLKVTAILATIALPTTAIIAVMMVPEGNYRRTEKSPSLRAALPAVVTNKPLLIFLATFATGGLSTGMAFGMLFFFVDSHLSLGGTLALLFVLGAPIGAAAMPFWAWLAGRIGKQRTWAVAYTASASFLLLHLLIPAGPDGEPWLIAAFVMVFLVSSVGVVVPAALLADIVDYGRWKYKADYAGSYFSIQTMVEKGVEGLGVALGLAIASWLGFDPTLEEQTEAGARGLLIAFPILPAILTYLTVPIIWKFPIDERRQKTIVRRLSRQEANS